MTLAGGTSGAPSALRRIDSTTAILAKLVRTTTTNGTSASAASSATVPKELSIPLHRRLDLQALFVAEDRRRREELVARVVAHLGVALGEPPVAHAAAPRLGVADVADLHVVVLAPEERHRREPLPLAQDVARRGLPLSLGHHPVLDAHGPPRARVGVARRVAGGPDTRDAGGE